MILINKWIIKFVYKYIYIFKFHINTLCLTISGSLDHSLLCSRSGDLAQLRRLKISQGTAGCVSLRRVVQCKIVITKKLHTALLYL